LNEPAELSKATRLLPVAVIAAAVCLFASELMTVFDFTPPGAEPLCAQGGADRHGNALIVLAVFAVIALAIAIFAGSKPAAIAVAAAGGVALLIFLIGDLRVANAQGSLNEGCGALGDSFIDAKAVPQGGFWLEMVGSLALTVTGIALATMSPEQLRGLRPARRERPTEMRGGEPAEHATANAASHAGGGTEEKGRLARLGRRPRTRQRG
jgi:hypothetical protein